jgi:hypothetical protein
MRGKRKMRLHRAPSPINSSDLLLAHCRGHGSATRNLSGVIICPAKRTAVVRRTPSPLGIIRFKGRKSTFRFTPGMEDNTALLGDGVRIRLRLHGLFRGHNAAVNPEREEAIPAGRAAIRGGAKEAVHPTQHAHSVLARNALHVQVAAHRAMHVPDVSDGSGPGVEARVADSATPWAQPGHADQIIFRTAPTRPAWTVAMTDRTKQVFSPLVNLQKG